MRSRKQLTRARPIGPGLMVGALIGLGGCVFDLDAYEPVGAAATGSTGVGASTSAGGGGAASSASGAPSSVSASVTASSTTDGSSSAQASSSTGEGGSGPVALAPCGGFTDDFQSFTSPPWDKHDAEHVGPANKKYVQTDIGFDINARAELGGAEYHDCFASIDLVGHSGGSAYLRLYQGLINQTSITIDGNKNLGFPGGSAELDDWPVALGLAFVDDQVFYLYVPKGSSAWQLVIAKARSGWMSDGNDDRLGFGVNGVINDSASFDSFNMRPITHADLGIDP